MTVDAPLGDRGGVARGGWHLVRVRGRSMLPTLDEGDLLLVRAGARPRPGDVVVVTLPGGRPLAVKRLTGPDPDGTGGWWVERDNPVEGVDSWAVGAVAPHHLHAVAKLRLWPRPRLLRRRPPGAAAQRSDSSQGDS